MAGSITTTTGQFDTGNGYVHKYSAAWISDASGIVSDNSFRVKSGFIEMVKFVPGSGGSQPTDLYDVTVLDADGVDVIRGAGANLSNAAASAATPITSVALRYFVEAGALTLTVTNAGNAKSGTVILYVR